MISRKIFSFFSITIYYTVLMCTELQTEWKKLPDLIPYHYNQMGVPDRFFEKNGLLAVPIFSIILVIVFMFLINKPPARIIPIKLTDQNREQVKGSTAVHLVILSIVLNMNLRTINGLLIHSKPLSIKPFVYSVIGFFVVMLLYRANILKYEDITGGDKKEDNQGNRAQRRSEKRAEAKINNKKKK